MPVRYTPACLLYNQQKLLFAVFNHRLPRFVAAFSMRFYANEMVFASQSGNLAAARNGLNMSTSGLRTWHERLLFGSSTQQLAPGAVQYQAHDAFPVYRSTPVIEQVRRCLCSEFSSYGSTRSRACSRHPQLNGQQFSP